MAVRERAAPRAVRIDGFNWNDEQERELNELAVALFSTGGGKQFMDYLRQITSAAHGPAATDAELRHAAGQRHLVAMIDQRIALGSANRKGESK